MHRSQGTHRTVAAIASVALLLALPALGAELTSLSGEVEIGRGEPPHWVPAGAGEALAAGDRVRTGHDGRAEIGLSRATIRLYPNSLLRVPDESAGAGPEVGLDRGRSLFDVLRGDRPFQVRTPEVVVSVKGTRFSVATDAAGAAVAVFRGSVGVRSLLLDVSREMMVREGFVASGNDTLALEPLDLPDPWDGFSGDVLPDVPQASDEKPSSASLEETRRTANSAARSEAVVRAAERHERVRERVDSRERGPDGGRKGLLDEASRATADATASAADGVDAVADAPAALAEELERNAVELWLNAASGGSLFDVTLLSNTGNSVDQVLIAVTGGGSWTLDESLVQSVLDGGQSLPQDLISELDAQGITDTDALAQQLLGLFR